MVKCLNVKPKTTKLPKQKHTGKVHDIGFNDDFLVMTPKIQATKAEKWHYLKLKNFCPAKETITSINRQPVE